ncbi:MAG: hypothetical protein WDO18_17345 [Acidobacteriota bacterium]
MGRTCLWKSRRKLLRVLQEREFERLGSFAYLPHRRPE